MLLCSNLCSLVELCVMELVCWNFVAELCCLNLFELVIIWNVCQVYDGLAQLCITDEL